MRLVGVMMVRNAADIIEACLRHNLAFLDGIAIVDHGSTDGTSDILAALLREGLPVFIGNEDEPAFNPPTVVNRLVRHVFATSDANWVFPLDCDEFLKTPSRAHLENTLRAVPPQRHLQLDWLTYVPQFDVGDDMLKLLRSARRLAKERHGVSKMAVGRHFLNDETDQIPKGNHVILRTTGPVPLAPCVKCAAENAALAHVPIRSTPQFVAKMANGWLANLAGGDIQGGKSSHQREAFEYLRSGRPVTRSQLNAFAMNYGVPQNRWLPADAIELIDDPFLADIKLTHEHYGVRDPLALVLAVAERLVKQAHPL